MATLQQLLGGGLPAGLLDEAQMQQAEERAKNAGLLNLGFALLQASRGQPGQGKPSLGQIIGQAGPVGVQGYQQSFDKTLQDAIKGMQISEMRNKEQERKRQQAAIEQYVSTLPEDQRARFAAFPTQAAEAMFREPKPAPGKVGEFQAAKQAGLIPPEMTLEDYKKINAPPGVNVNVKTGEGIAGQIGPILKEERVAATGAALQMDAADRVVAAIDTGKVLSGPGTSVANRALQIGNVLGVTGKDSNEVIANTRQAIRGLAELTLQGRKSMRGEGQITESEGKLAERAFSGDITDLTNDEIRILANASKRAAQFNLEQYNKRLDKLEQNSEAAAIIPFYRVNVMPSAQPSGLPSGVTVKRK